MKAAISSVIRSIAGMSRNGVEHGITTGTCQE